MVLLSITGTVRQCLGISCLSNNRYYDMIKLVYPHITEILDEMCEEGKEMNRMEDESLGSRPQMVYCTSRVTSARTEVSLLKLSLEVCYGMAINAGGR